MKLNAFYINKKNKTYYFAVKILTNATNREDGKKLVLYYPVDKEDLSNVDWDNGYVRDVEEFDTKFEILDI